MGRMTGVLRNRIMTSHAYRMESFKVFGVSL